MLSDLFLAFIKCKLHFLPTKAIWCHYEAMWRMEVTAWCEKRALNIFRSPFMVNGETKHNVAYNERMYYIVLHSTLSHDEKVPVGTFSQDAKYTDQN